MPRPGTQGANTSPVASLSPRDLTARIDAASPPPSSPHLGPPAAAPAALFLPGPAALPRPGSSRTNGRPAVVSPPHDSAYNTSGASPPPPPPHSGSAEPRAAASAAHFMPGPVTMPRPGSSSTSTRTVAAPTPRASRAASSVPSAPSIPSAPPSAAVVRETTWAERDAALRQQAVSLADSPASLLPQSPASSLCARPLRAASSVPSAPSISSAPPSVAVVREITWAERDAALRQQAVSLTDSPTLPSPSAPSTPLSVAFDQATAEAAMQRR